MTQCTQEERDKCSGRLGQLEAVHRRRVDVSKEEGLVISWRPDR